MQPFKIYCPWDFPHSFWNLKFSIRNFFATESFVCIHIWTFPAGSAYHFFILFQGFVMKIFDFYFNHQIFFNYYFCKFQLFLSIWIVAACESFRRFLHSENTRSDAFALVIFHYIFSWDVAVIVVDELLLFLLENFQFHVAVREKNLIVISHSRNPGSYQWQSTDSSQKCKFLRLLW